MTTDHSSSRRELRVTVQTLTMCVRHLVSSSLVDSRWSNTHTHTHAHPHTHIYTDRQTDRDTDRQTHRDTDRQTETQTDRHTETETDRQRHRQTHKDTDRQTDRHTKTQIDRQTDRQTDTQTDRHTKTQIDRQTDRDTNRQTDKHTDTHTHTGFYQVVRKWNTAPHKFPQPDNTALLATSKPRHSSICLSHCYSDDDHGLADSPNLYISHSAKYRKMADFDPSGSKNPWIDFDETWHGWLHPGPHPTRQLWWR